MRISTARWIDNVVGTPLCWALNVAARILGAILRRDHSLNPPPRRVLVIKLLGMGSIMLAAEMMARLKRELSEVEIRLLTFAANRPLGARIPAIDHVWYLGDSGLVELMTDVVRRLIAIWRWGPELVIDLEAYSKASTVLTTLTMARNRVELFVATTRFRRGLCTHLVYLNRFQRIHDTYAQIAELLTDAPAPSAATPEPPLVVREQDRADCAAALAAAGIAADERIVCLNPNASDLCIERRWPLEKMAALAGTLAGNQTWRVVLIGSPGERDYTAGVHAAIDAPQRERVVDLSGKTTFGGLLAMLQRAALLVTNDSGPMHLGDALGTPVVSLWGPGTPQNYGTGRSTHRAIFKNIYCSPCLYMVDRAPCNGDNQCMKRITVAEVAKACHELLGAPPPNPDTIREPPQTIRSTQLGVVRLRRA